MIAIKDLSHSFGAAPVLTDITLDIPRGGITALVGANGAGKSTLLSLIARLIPIQTGQIKVDDLTVGDCPTDELARKLSILPQTNEIAARLTVQELISFGRYPHHKGRPSSYDKEVVQTAITAFDLNSLAHRSLDTLSGGQRQRAQIAMIYAQETGYLLLDEPLNNLDIAASRSLMQLLQNLARKYDRTIVTVLHDINYASAYSDHIITMKAGRVHSTGAPSKIVNSDMILDVFDTNADVQTLNGQPVVCV
jgi:iron-siderophore transport system ATP-binding protein